MEELSEVKKGPPESGSKHPDCQKKGKFQLCTDKTEASALNKEDRVPFYENNYYIQLISVYPL